MGIEVSYCMKQSVSPLLSVFGDLYYLYKLHIITVISHTTYPKDNGESHSEMPCRS